MARAADKFATYLPPTLFTPGRILHPRPRPPRRTDQQPACRPGASCGPTSRKSRPETGAPASPPGWLAGLAGWLAGWLAWLAPPPSPPPLLDATTGTTGLSELGRRLDRKEAPATPEKAEPKANDRPSL